MLKKALRIEDVMKICHVPAASVLRWIQNQNLKTVRTALSQPLIWRSDLISFLESIREPVPHELVVLDNIIIVIAEYESEQGKWISDEIRDLFPHASLIEARDAFEAGQYVFELTPHLLILDFDMPGLDGRTVCKKLKSTTRLKFTKIIGFGRRELEKDQKEILADGADAFFPKPLLMNSFKDAVVFNINELV